MAGFRLVDCNCNILLRLVYLYDTAFCRVCISLHGFVLSVYVFMLRLSRTKTHYFPTVFVCVPRALPGIVMNTFMGMFELLTMSVTQSCGIFEWFSGDNGQQCAGNLWSSERHATDVQML
jgi:hypothetical protein